MAMTQTLPLLAYRSAVAEICSTLPADEAEVLEHRIRAGLSHPDIAGFLEITRAHGDFADDLVAEALRFRPTGISTARDVGAMVRVHLLSMIDAAWWAETNPYRTDEEIRRDPRLVDLRRARSAGALRFDFRVQVYDLPRRAFRAWSRRYRTGSSPLTIGMRLPFARPEMIALLNAVAADLADSAPSAPRLWVNSIMRSSEYQSQMRRAGYMAVTGSAHCAGWAADIEMQWMRQRGFGEALARTLLERAERGEINVIDEGQAWHICLNPAAALNFIGG